MEHFDEVVTDPRIRRSDIEEFIAAPQNLGRWYLGEYSVCHTSGSQGRPMLIVQDRSAIEIGFALLSARANARGRPGVLEGLRRWRHPARVAVIALKRGFYPSGATFELMEQISAPFVQTAWFSVAQSDLPAALRAYQPNILIGYASVLDALAMNAAELDLRNLWQVANSSEQLTPRARARIGDAFRVPVFDHYGLGECLLLSEGCPTDGGAHVNSDWAIAEVVDEQCRAVPAGTTGQQVLVTNLANHVLPIIRYVVPDRIALATSPCQCGSRLPRIARIEGRAAETFWVQVDSQSRPLTGVQFHASADSQQAVREWQAIQRGPDQIEIRLELLPSATTSFAEVAAGMRAKLHEFGVPPQVKIDIVQVGKLEPDSRTGKFRRMVVS